MLVKLVCVCSVEGAVCAMSFKEIISLMQSKSKIWLSSHPLYKNWIVVRRICNELSCKMVSNIERGILAVSYTHLDVYKRQF